MKKALTIGSSTQDIFILTPNPKSISIETDHKNELYTLLPQGKIDVKEIHYSTGGGATNAAICLNRLGFYVWLCSSIANDSAGEFIKNRLHQNNISTNLIQSSELETAISFILPTQEKDYTALVHRAANKDLDTSKFTDEDLKNFDLLYISGLSPKSAFYLPRLVTQAKSIKLFTATNPSSNQIINHFDTIYNSLKYLDLLILNKSEAQKFFLSFLDFTKLNLNKKINLSYEEYPKIFNDFVDFKSQNYGLTDFFNLILENGTKIIAVTDGAHGVYVATKDFILFSPIVKVEVVNTIGAGDAFGSTLSGLLTLGYSIEDALIYASINSASVVNSLDTNEGLLTLDKLKLRFDKVDKSKLRKFLWTSK